MRSNMLVLRAKGSGPPKANPRGNDNEVMHPPRGVLACFTLSKPRTKRGPARLFRSSSMPKMIRIWKHWLRDRVRHLSVESRTRSMRHLKAVAVAVAGVFALTLVHTVLRGRIAIASEPSLQDQGLRRVSGTSPFQADCNGATFPISAAYINAEVEPYVAINPTNPNNLIAVYQEDRYPDDGANGVLAAVSFDGGRNWQVPTLQYQPLFSRCADLDGTHGGDFEMASDPWVDFGADGTAYFAALAFNKSDAETAEFVSVSHTGGRTWARPVSVIRENVAHVSDERPAVSADPTRQHTAYLVWDRHRSAPATKAAGAIFFSRTADGGKSWSTARAIYETPIGVQTSANQVVVMPNGDLVNVFNELGLDTGSHHPRHDRIALIRSADGGLTWSKPTTLATSSVAGVKDPQTGAMVRAGDSFTDIAVDPRPGTNTIYAVWGDSRFAHNGTQQIVLAKSIDSGRTWSEPVPVSAAPGTQAFVPSVAVNDHGEVAVTYYSFSAGMSDSRALRTQYWIALSPDGGQTWPTRQQVTPRPFNLRTTPYNGGFFVGEYQGLAGAGPFFVAVATFANGRSLDNRTDIFSCTATLGGYANPRLSGPPIPAAVTCRNSGLVSFPQGRRRHVDLAPHP